MVGGVSRGGVGVAENVRHFLSFFLLGNCMCFFCVRKENFEGISLRIVAR